MRKVPQSFKPSALVHLTMGDKSTSRDSFNRPVQNLALRNCRSREREDIFQSEKVQLGFAHRFN